MRSLQLQRAVVRCIRCGRAVNTLGRDAVRVFQSNGSGTSQLWMHKSDWSMLSLCGSCVPLKQV